MTRWVLVREGKVRGYMDHPPVVTEADRAQLAEAQRQRAFGPDDDGTRPMEPEGEWVIAPPEAGLVGDDWLWDGTKFLPRA